MAEWVGELLSQSSGGSSSSSTSNCYKLTINGTANGGSGNRTYYADSEGNIYNKAGCVGTTVTKIGTGTKTNASFAGIYLYASGNGAQCADASGNYNLTNCPITGDTTWYATYSCQTGYTENATTKACEATASLTMTIKDRISSPAAVKITNSNFVCNPNGDTKIVMSDYVTIDYTETEKIGLASGCIKLCYDPVVEGVEDNASQYCSTVPKTKCVNGGNMYILVDGYCVL
jgi:hypothetical protein